MNRREFVAHIGVTLGSVLICNATLLWAQASTGSLRRVGVLAPSTNAKEEIVLKPFFDQMRELGWIEGQNIAYDRVYAEDKMEMLPRLAAELVARRPEVIYAPPTPATVAAKQATQTIPIVFAMVSDPVGIGLVTSLARPGGNVTGMSSTSEFHEPKRVQLLREILPGAKRIGRLADSNDPVIKSGQQSLAPLAASLGLTFPVAEAANPVEFEAAVARLVAERVDAIMVVGTGALAYNLRARLIELANQKRLPIIAGSSLFADLGALFTYGPSVADRVRRSAIPVDKILKGAKPADLPVEQPALFEMIVNMKTAKALGIRIPPSILLRADRVIE